MLEVFDLKQHNQKSFQEIVLNLFLHHPQLLLVLSQYISVHFFEISIPLISLVIFL